MEEEFAAAEGIANFILKKVRCRPTLGIICGSGLGKVPESFENQEILPFSSIPNFPLSFVKGHEGNLIMGKWNGVETICMQGRVHPYEGYTMKRSALPIRAMKLLGVKLLILTNAAGGVNDNYKPGDIMLIKDHIGLPTMCGLGPLVGVNDERFGTRFPGMSHTYDKNYRTIVKDFAKKLNINIHEGVYTMTFGPQYESPAEVRMIRQNGGDAVGMSTVYEVLAAAHSGIKVVAFSLIANTACSDCDDESPEACHEEVIAVMNKASSRLIELLELLVAKIAKDGL